MSSSIWSFHDRLYIQAGAELCEYAGYNPHQTSKILDRLFTQHLVINWQKKDASEGPLYTLLSNQRRMKEANYLTFAGCDMRLGMKEEARLKIVNACKIAERDVWAAVEQAVLGRIADEIRPKPKVTKKQPEFIRRPPRTPFYQNDPYAKPFFKLEELPPLSTDSTPQEANTRPEYRIFCVLEGPKAGVWEDFSKIEEETYYVFTNREEADEYFDRYGPNWGKEGTGSSQQPPKSATGHREDVNLNKLARDPESDMTAVYRSNNPSGYGAPAPYSYGTPSFRSQTFSTYTTALGPRQTGLSTQPSYASGQSNTTFPAGETLSLTHSAANPISSTPVPAKAQQWVTPPSDFHIIFSFDDKQQRAYYYRTGVGYIWKESEDHIKDMDYLKKHWKLSVEKDEEFDEYFYWKIDHQVWYDDDEWREDARKLKAAGNDKFQPVFENTLPSESRVLPSSGQSVAAVSNSLSHVTIAAPIGDPVTAPVSFSKKRDQRSGSSGSTPREPKKPRDNRDERERRKHGDGTSRH